VAEADEVASQVIPQVDAVVEVEVTGEAFTAAANRRADTMLQPEELFDLLQHEPSTWGGLQALAAGWKWDLTRSRLRPYRGVKTGEEYLTVLEQLVGISQHVVPPVVSPTELPEAFDHLDLAWRLRCGGKRLVKVPRASVVARLTQPVNSRDEFDARCSALSDLLSNLQVPPDGLPAELKSLARLQRVMPGLTGEDAVAAVGAVGVLRQVAGIRNSQQHTGSADRYDKDWTALGLPRFGSDWPGAWRQVQAATLDALRQIREALVSQLE
jgi:hypothetical protein